MKKSVKIARPVHLAPMRLYASGHKVIREVRIRRVDVQHDLVVGAFMGTTVIVTVAAAIVIP
jgi:hypothetical protein